MPNIYIPTELKLWCNDCGVSVDWVGNSNKDGIDVQVKCCKCRVDWVDTQPNEPSRTLEEGEN